MLVIPFPQRFRRGLAALLGIEVGTAVTEQFGIFVDIGIGEYERVDVSTVAHGILPLERRIEGEAGITRQLLGEDLHGFGGVHVADVS